MLVSRTLSCVDCAVFFFFNDTATTEIYTLSLHDALPISGPARGPRALAARAALRRPAPARRPGDRKSTRLNSSHSQISYAVFCLKKKKKNKQLYAPHTRSSQDRFPRTKLIAAGWGAPTGT